MRYFSIAIGLSLVLFALGYFSLNKLELSQSPGVLSSTKFTEESGSVNILFGGDMMFDRYIRQVAESRGGGFLFSCINSTLSSPHLVVANLEGPITSNDSKSVGSIPGGENNYTFTFSTSTARLLNKVGIDIVNIGNNHSHDFGLGGVKETAFYLEEAGVDFFGDALEYKTIRKNVNGVKIEFINYNEFGGSAEKTVLDIKKAKEAGYLPIVYTHWGDEYEYEQLRLKELAHRFVDAGAEVIIGSHPHVVGQVEEYKNKVIFYSLGNFIFDQYFQESVRNGLLVSVDMKEEGIAGYRKIPIELTKDGRSCLSSVD